VAPHRRAGRRGGDRADPRAGPRLVALSGHDSTAWTFGAFERAFGDGYRTLRVGGELRIAGG
jgi:hypothetical protein